MQATGFRPVTAGSKLRAFDLADNQFAFKSGWDIQILDEELSELIDLDLSVTGFDWPKVDAIIHPNEVEAESDLTDCVSVAPKTAVTRLGDIWLIGRHRPICGDPTKPETFEALLGDQKACADLSMPKRLFREEGVSLQAGNVAPNQSRRRPTPEVKPVHESRNRSDQSKRSHRACRCTNE